MNTRSTIAQASRLVAPLILFAAAASVWWLSDRLVQVGPFDRAKVGWFVVVPVLALSPAVAALAGGRAMALSAVVAALVVTIGLSLMITRIGCAPVGTALEIIPSAMAVGVTVGAGFAASSYAGLVAGRKLAGHSVWATVLVSPLAFVPAMLVSLLVFAALFPPVSCPAS